MKWKDRRRKLEMEINNRLMYRKRVVGIFGGRKLRLLRRKLMKI